MEYLRLNIYSLSLQYMIETIWQVLKDSLKEKRETQEEGGRGANYKAGIADLSFDLLDLIMIGNPCQHAFSPSRSPLYLRHMEKKVWREEEKKKWWRDKRNAQPLMHYLLSPFSHHSSATPCTIRVHVLLYQKLAVFFNIQ